MAQSETLSLFSHLQSQNTHTDGSVDEEEIFAELYSITLKFMMAPLNQNLCCNLKI